MKIKTFTGCFCSQKFFSRLIGKSYSYVYQLKCLGVVSTCRAGVLLFQSLETYYNSYLPTEKRQKELQAAIKRIDALKISEKSTPAPFLKSARALRQNILDAKMKIILLKFFNRLDVIAAPKSLLLRAEKDLQQIKAEFLRIRYLLRRAILDAKLPVKIESVILSRYVDCETFSDVAESNSFSIPYAYVLHRQGRNYLAQIFR